MGNRLITISRACQPVLSIPGKVLRLPATLARYSGRANDKRHYMRFGCIAHSSTVDRVDRSQGRIARAAQLRRQDVPNPPVQ
jgi:hypothetical protein